jgi:hypothetical protein
MGASGSFGAASLSAMTVWAYEELTQGVNLFRNLLGLGYMISTAVHLAVALHRWDGLRGGRARARTSPRLDALDWAPRLDSQSHVEHDAAAGHATDRVEVGLDHLRDLPEQEGKAQDQLA